MFARLLVPLFVVTLALPLFGKAQAVPYYSTVQMQVPFAPSVVIVSGQRYVSYELHLTNFANDTLELTSLTVKNTANGKSVAKFQEAGLNARYIYPGKKAKAKSFLLPGASGVIFIEFSLAVNTAPPSLAHQVGLGIRNGNLSTNLMVNGAVTPVHYKDGVIVAAPLKGAQWAAVYDPSWERGHRRVFYTVDGKARLPGRYAIDLIKLDGAGRYAAGDENLISNWYGYGADVLAACDGIVSSVKTDAIESPTLSGYTAPAPGNATGNYVSIKLKNQQYIFYEHLKPGSIRVKPGQHVKKGQVIAAIGFTGQTTGPHLHFHIADTNSPLGAEGLPFGFTKFHYLGAYSDFSGFGKLLWIPVNDGKGKNVRGERPAPNSVISFDRD